MSFPSLRRAMRRRWPTAAMTLAVVAGVAAGSSLCPPSPATATARVVVGHERVGDAFTGGAGPAASVEGPSASAVEALVRSEAVLALAAHELAGGGPAAPSAQAVASLHDAISATRRDGRLQVVEVSASMEDADEALRAANAVARAIVATTETEIRCRVENALAQVRRRAEAAAARLAAARSQVQAHAGAGGDPDASKASLLQAIRDLDLRLDELRAGAAQKEEALKALLPCAHADSATDAPPVLPAAATVTRLKYLAATLARAQNELATLTVRSVPDDPDLRAWQSKVDGLRSRFAEAQESWRVGRMAALQTEVDQARHEIESLERSRVERAADLAALTEGIAVYRAARRESEAAEHDTQAYCDLERRLESLRTLLPRFVEVAETAEHAVRPNRIAPFALALWLALGLGLAAAAACLREALDPRVTSEGEARKLLNLPTVGHVARVSDADLALGLRGEPDAVSTEVFGSLATLLRASMGEGGMKTVGVLSVGPGEGKTSIAVGLASAIARKGLRTVLIDSDLRHPAIHVRLGIENGGGLSTLLEGRGSAAASEHLGRSAEASGPSDLDLALQEQQDSGLRIITGGPALRSPQLLLESASMKGILDELKESTDVVVVDTPALGSFGEGLSIATMTDANLLVVGSGMVTGAQLDWARRLLGSVAVNLLGFILNFSDWRPCARAAVAVRRVKQACRPPAPAAAVAALEPAAPAAAAEHEILRATDRIRDI